MSKKMRIWVTGGIVTLVVFILCLGGLSVISSSLEKSEAKGDRIDEEEHQRDVREYNYERDNKAIEKEYEEKIWGGLSLSQQQILYKQAWKEEQESWKTAREMFPHNLKMEALYQAEIDEINKKYLKKQYGITDDQLYNILGKGAVQGWSVR